MKKIRIEIKDNLSKEQEIIAIARKLANKTILLSNHKVIGSSIEVQDLETQITIIRKPSERTLITKECSVCKTIFQKSSGISLYQNIGGKVRLSKYCSKECSDIVVNFLGDRGSYKRKDLVFITFF